MTRFLGVLLVLALACGYPNGPCPDEDERYVPQVGPEFGYPDPRPPDESGEPTSQDWVCPSGAPFDGSRHWMLDCGAYFCDDAFAESPDGTWYCVDRDHLDAWMDKSCKGCWLNNDADAGGETPYAVWVVCDVTK